jgi:hypothetical protein
MDGRTVVNRSTVCQSVLPGGVELHRRIRHIFGFARAMAMSFTCRHHPSLLVCGL